MKVISCFRKRMIHDLEFDILLKYHYHSYVSITKDYSRNSIPMFMDYLFECFEKCLMMNTKTDIDEWYKMIELCRIRRKLKKSFSKLKERRAKNGNS